VVDKFEEKKKRIRNILYSVYLLTFLGLIAIFDVSPPLALENFSDKYFFVKQHFFSTIVGFTVFFFFTRIKPKFYKFFSLPFFLINLVFLVMVFIPKFGVLVYGARRWISFGIINFQPSEFLKLSLILYLASLVEKKVNFSLFFSVFFFASLLVLLEPDFGTFMVIASIWFSLFFVFYFSFRRFLTLGLFFLSFTLLMILAYPYRRERFFSFFKNGGNLSGPSYHVQQSLLAIGSGRLTGVGIGQSKQKYLFLPESVTDSIFAVVSEETGFLGSLILILIFLFLIINVLNISLRSNNEFNQAVYIGFSSWIFSQVFLNLSSLTKLLPLTGIPLPFISYGGSSLVSILASLGIILSLLRHEK